MEYDIQQRKEHILKLINLSGKVRVSELSRYFNISEVTIRMDLVDLESKGLLSRVHGGAISTYKTYYNMSLGQRQKTNESEKRAIADKLCDFIKDNDTLFMNSGTSTVYALHAISSFKNISIVTNSIALAMEASTYATFKVLLLGGNINFEYQFTFGIDAERQLENYHADKSILSIDGVTVSTGLSTFYKEEAELCRKMTQQCDKTIVLADYSKIGRTAFTRIAPITSADLIISNDRPIDEIHKIKKKGVEMALV